MANRSGKSRLYPLWLIALGLVFTYVAQAQETALDRYVARPDPNYAFTEYRTQREIGYTVHFLRMISQQWRSASEVDRPIWEHEVIILIPRVALDTTKTAVLLIDGGSNGGTPTTSVPQVLGMASIATGAVIAAVRQVPNQPLFFPDDPGRGRKEDEILAYSLDQALVTGDLEWPVHLAMTKAAVRAMDTVQEFAARRGQEVRDFLVMGGSKRGWTTWLTAAVDPRVRAILPASIDMLNLSRQFVHHWEAYGFFAPAIDDYVEFDLPCRAQTPAGREVLRVVDPYAYRDRYAGLPKLVLNASGDQFFVTDSSRFYFAGLPGPKWLRYTPNTDHKLNQDAIVNAMSWIDDVLNDKASANIDWTVTEDGALRVTTSSRPREVRLWQATNPNARDFRLEMLGAAWASRVLTAEPDGAYVGFVPPPARGWTAFFVEVTFATAGVLKPDQVYTTDVLITPDVLPYAGTACDDPHEEPCQPPFDDIPCDHWARGDIEKILAAGITGGCGNNNYCPLAPVTRAQMAAFLLRGLYGGDYSLPPATGAVFLDVPRDHDFAREIEQLAREEITRGCGGGNYCPNAPITRREMAVFLLRAKHGADYDPPPATGARFGDVPASDWAAAWIEQLAQEGITGGCGGGNYCPDAAANRDQMAAFLVRTFNL